jgi:hypothetical protein
VRELPELEVSVVARSDRFAPDDDRWLSQTRLLHQDLARTAERVALHTRETPGAKGGGLEVVVVLTPAVTTAVVAAIRAWVSRDRDRSAFLQWQTDGQITEFRVTIDNGDNAALCAALEHGLRAAGGSTTELSGDVAEERRGDVDARE